jgi:drug/metabolite transporter (DMT)-like permease
MSAVGERENDSRDERTHLPAQGLLLLALLTLIWGTNWPVMKIAATAMPILLVRTVCAFGTGILVLAIAGASRLRVGLSPTEWRWIVPVAVFNATGWLYLTALSLTYTTSGHTSVAAYTMPLWVFLIGAIFLGERPTAGKWVGLGLGSAAIAILFARNLDAGIGDWRGIVAMLGGAISWAIGTILMKRVAWTSPTVVIVGWQFFLGGLPLAVLAIPEYPALADVSATTYAAIAYTVAVGIVLAYFLWFRIVQMVPAWVASLSVLAVPAVGLVSGAVMLGEPLGFAEWTALGLLVAGVSTVLPRRGGRRPIATDPRP